MHTLIHNQHTKHLSMQFKFPLLPRSHKLIRGNTDRALFIDTCHFLGNVYAFRHVHLVVLPCNYHGTNAYTHEYLLAYILMHV